MTLLRLLEADQAGAGDMWYNDYHQTTVMIWGDSNHIEGGERSGSSLDTAYSILDQCNTSSRGETYLISYSSCVDYISLAKITW